ncbi:MAG: lipoprotein-releasing ABC transporter ATP-binding protein LolD [Granulosicoccaceae bacterium]
MTDVVIHARDLRRRYDEGSGRVDVLNGVNLDVSRGERLAIIGSSGSGKSTLLHLLGALDKPSTGDVHIAGENITAMKARAAGEARNRLLGFVYQFHHLLAEFNALENVALPLMIRGEKPKEAEARAEHYLKRVGLASRLSHKPGQLSGGERQRAAIARALVTEPCCVLADEPTGNLDDANSGMIYELLTELSQDSSTAFVVVTHDSALAARMDRTLVLKDGGLESFVAV